MFCATKAEDGSVSAAVPGGGRVRDGVLRRAVVGAAGRAPRVRNPPQGVRGEGSGAGEEQEPPLRLAGGGLITRADQLGSRRGRETSRGRSGRWLSREGGCAATGGCVCDVLPHVHSVAKCTEWILGVRKCFCDTERRIHHTRASLPRGLVARPRCRVCWPNAQQAVAAPWTSIRGSSGSRCQRLRRTASSAKSPCGEWEGEGGIRGVSEEPHRVVVSKRAAEG